MNKNQKIYVSGHNGMVGSALVRLLIKSGYTNLLLKSKDELNLLDKKAVTDLFKNRKTGNSHLRLSQGRRNSGQY